MQPPPMGLSRGPNSKTQLYDWQEIGYFDRSSECDAARQFALNAYPADSSNMQMSSTAANSIELSRQFASATRCVSTTDPRLDRWPVLTMLTSKF